MAIGKPDWQIVRKNFTAGVLVVIPLVLTVFVLRYGVTMVDGILDEMISFVAPAKTHPFFRFPGRGLITFVLITYLVGLVARNFFGQKLIDLSERFVQHIPFVRSIYSTFKQIIQAIFDTGSRSFESVVLVQFPHDEYYSVGFITAPSIDEVQEKTHIEEDMVSVFVPTAPNITTGFFIQCRRSKTIPLNMPVDDGIKYVISSGMVHGRDKPVRQPNPEKIDPKGSTEA